MRRFLKFIAVALSALVLLVILLAGLAFGYMRWQFHLPSDAKAKACFVAHKDALDALVQMVTRRAHRVC